MSEANPQLIHVSDDDAVGFICISSKDFFKQVVANFDSASCSTSFVDTTVDKILRKTIDSIHPSLLPRGWKTDKPPYFHVQTVGHVAGVDEYVPGSAALPNSDSLTVSRDPELWGDLATKVLGVSIHPKYGGWYAYRMLIVVDGLRWPAAIPKSEPVKFLSDAERELIISEYNRNADLCRWRDFNDKQFGLERYDPAQYAFFTERSIQKRRRILELLKAELIDLVK